MYVYTYVNKVAFVDAVVEKQDDEANKFWYSYPWQNFVMMGGRVSLICLLVFPTYTRRNIVFKSSSLSQGEAARNVIDLK